MRRPHIPLSQQVIAIVEPIIGQEVADYLTANPPTGGLTIDQIKADTAIDAAIDNTHAPGSDNQDLSGLVVKETGKGLSTNDYTTVEQSKLSGIEIGAEVNNISDINATDLTDGGETSLHTHASSGGLTQQQIEGFI